MNSKPSTLLTHEAFNDWKAYEIIELKENNCSLYCIQNVSMLLKEIYLVIDKIIVCRNRVL